MDARLHPFVPSSAAAAQRPQLLSHKARLPTAPVAVHSAAQPVSNANGRRGKKLLLQPLLPVQPDAFDTGMTASNSSTNALSTDSNLHSFKFAGKQHQVLAPAKAPVRKSLFANDSSTRDAKPDSMVEGLGDIVAVPSTLISVKQKVQDLQQNEAAMQDQSAKSGMPDFSTVFDFL